MKRETQRIVPGGLNWLGPGDQVADGDSLDLYNWRCGTAGELVQAPVAAVVRSAPINTNLNSCAYVGGRRYYGGPNVANGYLYRDATQILTTLSLGYIGLVGYQNWCWIMDSASGQQWKDDGTNTWKWTPGAPTAAPTVTPAALAGGVPPGECDYYITFINTLGQESNPSPVQTVTVVAGTERMAITVTGGSNPDTTQNTSFHVYRKDANMAVPYRVTPAGGVLVANTFTDDGDSVETESSEYLINSMPALEGDHDPAPAAKVVANKDYNGRIVVANSSTYPNRIWWTPATLPYYFPGSALSSNQDGANWLDVGEGESIYAITVHARYLLIYTSRGIWRHYGDMGSGTLEMVAHDVGAVGFRAVVSTSRGDYFRGKEGVYRMTDWAEKISHKIEPLFQGRNIYMSKSFLTYAEYPGEESKCALGYRNGRLWVSYATQTLALYNGGTVVCDLDSQRWLEVVDRGSAFCDEGQLQNFMAANGINYSSLETTHTASDFRYQSRYEDQGFPDTRKTYSDLVITHNTQDKTLTVVVVVNNGRATTDEIQLDATLDSTTLTRQVVPLVYPAAWAVTALRGQPIEGLNIAIRITGQGATTPLEIHGPLILHYYIQQRKARVFDTGPIDHGTQAVKRIDLVELDVDNTDGQITLTIYSDIPGGMTTRVAINIAAAAGRRKIPVVVANWEGKLFRYTVGFTKGSPGAEEGFLLYGLRVRALPIGVYVDGAVSESWDTEPISVGV